MRMLIIEDDVNLSNSLGMSLINLKIVDSQNLFKAYNLSEAIEIKEFLSPSVILLDLNLPDSSGGETYFKVKEIFKDTSIIILTGTNDTSLGMELVLAGAHDFLLKTEIKNVELTRVIQSAKVRYNLILEIQESEKRLYDIIEFSPIPLITLDRLTQEFTNVNVSFVHLCGMHQQEDILKPSNEFILSEIEFLKNEIFANLYAKEFKQIQCKNESSGITRHFDIKANVFSEKEIVAMIIDRTSEVEFENRKNALINDVEEAERKSLSRELHDGIAQNHVLMQLLLETLPLTEETRLQLKPIENVIKKSLEETISISYRLNPPDLRNGLEAGLTSLIYNINSTGLLSCQLCFDSTLVESDLLNINILNLYRIVQEFINNSIKYSACTLIEVTLQKNGDNEVYFLIRDNGKGFDMLNSKGKGLGTANLVHRLELLNFKGDYLSEIGKGTWIEGTFFLDNLSFYIPS